jgi:hypothetical protein
MAPVVRFIAVQIMKRSWGMFPWVPFATTPIVGPTPAAAIGFGGVTTNGARLGQVTRKLTACGPCGVPAAHAIPVVPSAAAHTPSVAATAHFARRASRTRRPARARRIMSIAHPFLAPPAKSSESSLRVDSCGVDVLVHRPPVASAGNPLNNTQLIRGDYVGNRDVLARCRCHAATALRVGM